MTKDLNKKEENDLDIKNRHLSLRGRVFPSDLNHNGGAFGGWIMAKMDKAASIAVEEIILSNAVTVFVTDMHFKYPVHNGDVFSIYTTIKKIGTTSITIFVDFVIKSRDTAEEFSVTNANFTFVSMNKRGHKVEVRKVIRHDVPKYVSALLEIKK